MNLEARKISFIQEFLSLQNEEIISALENFLKLKQSELIEETVTPMSIEQYNSEIDKAMSDSENRRMVKVADLKTKIQEWN